MEPAIQYAFCDSSLGRALVARTSDGICAVLLGEEDAALAADLGRRFPRAALHHDESGDDASQVRPCLDDAAAVLSAPLDLRGTEFQRAVWSALRAIPAGQTVSYTEIAHRVGRPGSVRAVGQAIGANPVAVIVPCHRVIRSDGAISGYRWGVERKRALLARERR